MTAALNSQSKVDNLMSDAKAAGFAHNYTTAVNKENEAITETSRIKLIAALTRLWLMGIIKLM